MTDHAIKSDLATLSHTELFNQYTTLDWDGDDQEVRRKQLAADELALRLLEEGHVDDRPTDGVFSRDAVTPDTTDTTTTTPATADTTDATLHFDGACRDNPGPSAIGFTLNTDDASVTHGSRIGEATNNQAEYHALITGLQAAQTHDISSITIRGDSQLVVKQVQEEWACNDATLQDLRDRVHEQLAHFDDWRIEHIPREDNTDADDAANNAFDIADDPSTP